MESIKRQRGMFSLGGLYLVLSLGFFVFLAFKVVPPYFDNVYIQQALKDLSTLDRESGELSSDEIRKRLGNFFTINNIRGDVINQIKIKRKSGAVIVKIDYERRVPLFANVEVVMDFQNHWNSKYPEQCCKPQISEKP